MIQMKVYNFFPTTVKLLFYNQNVILGTVTVGPYSYVSSPSLTGGVPYTYISVENYIGMDGYNSTLDKTPGLYYTFAKDPNVQNDNSLLVLTYDPNYYDSMNSISSNSSINYKLMKQYSTDFKIVAKDARAIYTITKDRNPSFYSAGTYILSIPRLFDPPYTMASTTYVLGSQDSGSSGDCYITADPSIYPQIDNPFYDNGMLLDGYCNSSGTNCYPGQQLFLNLSMGNLSLNGDKPVTVLQGSYNWMVHRYANFEYNDGTVDIQDVEDIMFDYGENTGSEPVLNFLNNSNPIITIFANDPTITDGKLHGFYPRFLPNKQFSIYTSNQQLVASVNGGSPMIYELYNYGEVRVIVAPGGDTNFMPMTSGRLMKFISDNVEDTAIWEVVTNPNTSQPNGLSNFQGQPGSATSSWGNFFLVLFVLIIIVVIVAVAICIKEYISRS